MKNFGQKHWLKINSAVFILAMLTVFIWQGYSPDFKVKAQAVDCGNINGDSIPAVCEGQDVVITGGTVFADKVKIDQDDPSRSECFDANDQSCDSKRNFKSLTIKDGAVLTHQAPTADRCVRGTPGAGQTGCGQQSWREYDSHIEPGEISIAKSKESLATQSTGTVRWKKVDLGITGDIILERRGKIDASGKGYPGGSPGPFDPDNFPANSEGNNGFGPGGGGYAYYDGNEDAYLKSGSGGHAGRGTLGNCNRGDCSDIRSAPAAGAKYSDTDFDFGSGGGGVWAVNGGGPFYDTESAKADGGNGGGRIRITAGGVFVIGSQGESYISAAGGNGIWHRGSSFDHKVVAAGWSAAGAGGTIIINANIIAPMPSSQPNNIEAGKVPLLSVYPNPLLSARKGIASASENNFGIVLYANGGDGGQGDGALVGDSGDQAGGGGGGLIIIDDGLITPPITREVIKTRNITVQVQWKERGTDKTLEIPTVLNNYVEQLITP